MLSELAHKYIILIFTLLACALSGCTTTAKVSHDFRNGTDFKAYKSFGWHNFSSDITPSNQVEIQRALEQKLIQQGFKFAQEGELPDVILDLTIIKRTDTRSSTNVGISLGLPVGRNAGIGLGTNKLLGQEAKSSGLIILDITAKDPHQIVWRGSAENIPLDYFSLRKQAELNKIIDQLVSQFPPK